MAEQPVSGEGRPSPRVRAEHVRTTLQILAARHPAAASTILSALPPEALDEIRAAARNAWIPTVTDVVLWRAIRGELGPAGAASISRAVSLDHLKGGLLSGLLRAVLRLFEATPGALLRWAPRAFDELHQGAGTLRVDSQEDGRGVFVLEDLHPALADEAWLQAVAGGLESCLDVCEVDGECTLQDFGADRAVIVLGWRPRGGSR